VHCTHIEPIYFVTNYVCVGRELCTPYPHNYVPPGSEIMYLHVDNYVGKGYRRLCIICTKTYIIRHKFVDNYVRRMWIITQGGTVIALQMQQSS
jgi:hypothetical protein